MSHHFSPEFTVLPPGKEPVSKKLQRNSEQTSSARHKEIQKLDFDNKQMEWKLNQLKQAMSKEKEDRGKQANIWKSGNARIESHSRNILGRTVSATMNGTQKMSPMSGSKSASKLKQPQKVKVLRDEPLDLPQRDSRTKDLIHKLQSDKPPAEGPLRSQDIETPIRRECWIDFAINRDSTDVFELQSGLDGNLKLSTIQAMDPTAVGVYFMKWGRKRLLIAADGVIRKPKTGWGEETYYPYSARSLPEMPIKPEPPLRNVSNTLMMSPEPPLRSVPNTLMMSPELKERNSSGGLLLQGNFDESKNAAAFQQALNEWRRGKEEKNSERRTKNPGRKTVRVPEMSVHVAQSTSDPFEVKFSETSTLSYMEHVLLQKHRHSEVPPMPKSLTETVNAYLENESDENGVTLTEEEEEERKRYRELFSPEPANFLTFSSEKVFSISEIDQEGDMDATDQCYVDESPPVSPPPLESAKSSQTVIIEEITYGVAKSVDQSQIMEDRKKAYASLMEDEENVRKSPSPNFVESKKFESKITPAKKQERQEERRSNSARLQSHRSTEKSIRKDETKQRSKTSVGSYSSKMDKSNRISQNPSSIVHEISKIPINPDTIYRRGLNEFFCDEDAPQKNNFPSENHSINFPTYSEVAKNSESWNVMSSVVTDIPLSPSVRPTANFQQRSSPGTESEQSDDSASEPENHPQDFPTDSEVVKNSKSWNVISSDATGIPSSPNIRPAANFQQKPSSGTESEQYDDSSLDNDSADGRALDNLEWELASQTGNVTSDGRISRLIDEWSQEDDLEIIDVPMIGSGLSTPDVRSSCISRVSIADPKDPQMQYDFQNIEQMIMADLSDEYSDDEL